MKKLISLLCLAPALLLAQEETPAVSQYPGYHRHDGFYLSMNIGPALGGTVLKMENHPLGFQEAKYSGGGLMLDLKIGGAIRENTIISFDVIGRSISEPDLEVDGAEGSVPSGYGIADNSYGIGVTQYFMPHNIFVSGTISTARMVQTMDGDAESTSDWGYAVHVKVGKEWWVGKNWGLGVSAGYGFAMADDKTDSDFPDYSGTLTSNQLYVLFNTTFN